LRLVLKKNDGLLKKIKAISGEDIYACYQCGMCSAGCPMGQEMDLLPNQVIRLLQIGAERQVLHCRTVWLCASCFTCTARCPKGVNLARLMEGVRLFLLRTQKEDHFSPQQMVKEPLPPIALIGALRKFTT